jgi:MFS family permease
MALIGLATNVVVWIIANLINGVVLAFGAYAAIAGVIAEFQGEKTQGAFGIVGGVGALLVATEVLIESQLLNFLSYREIFYLFALVCLVIGLFSNMVLIGKMPSSVMKKAAGSSGQGDQSKDVGEDVRKEKPKEAPGIMLKEALRGPALYLFVAAMFFGACALNGIASYLTLYLTTFEMSAAAAAGIMSLYTAVMAVYKFGAGLFMKLFRAKGFVALIFIAFSIGVGCLLYWSQTGMEWLVFLGILLIGFVGFVTIMPGLFVPEIFGMRDYVSINSAGMAGFYLGAAVLIIGLASVVSAIGIFSAYAVLIVLALIAMVCLVAALFLSPFKKR